jgi:hypothetical protein
MVHKQKTTTTVPEAIFYTQFKIPLDVSLDIPSGSSLSDTIYERISLEVQGEPVEVSEEYPIPILMAIFDVVHKISPETVLRLKSGKRVLLFDHWGVPVLRDEDVYVIDEVEKYEKELEGFTPELAIDIEAIWKEIGKEDDFESIKKSLNEIKKLIKPSMVTTLIGKAPALLFLLTQHLLYGKTGEIWYQENSTSVPIRINRL